MGERDCLKDVASIDNLVLPDVSGHSEPAGPICLVSRIFTVPARMSTCAVGSLSAQLPCTADALGVLNLISSRAEASFPLHNFDNPL